MYITAVCNCNSSLSPSPLYSHIMLWAAVNVFIFISTPRPSKVFRAYIRWYTILYNIYDLILSSVCIFIHNEIFMWTDERFQKKIIYNICTVVVPHASGFYAPTHRNTLWNNTRLFISLYTYICLCVCVCVCNSLIIWINKLFVDLSANNKQHSSLHRRKKMSYWHNKHRTSV
jgi:hypothetical protein